MLIKLSNNLNSDIVQCGQITIETENGQRTILPNHISSLFSIKKNTSLTYLDLDSQSKSIEIQHKGVLYISKNKASLLIDKYD
jgi:F0F1-type ATP synthase epsilon subunit